jgi:hypothetical protein
MERDEWRWAWETLKPPVMHVDLEVVRRTLTDHLTDHVITVDDQASIPFLFDVVTGKPGSYRNWNRYHDSFPVPPRRPANAPVTAHELNPDKSAELAAWARNVSIDLDPKANELDQLPKVIMGFVSKGIRWPINCGARQTVIQVRVVRECRRKDRQSSTVTFAYVLRFTADVYRRVIEK